jgi:hypothetical protein
LPSPGVTTLGTIRASAQSQADMVGDSFLSTAEWNSFINEAYQELYGLLVEAYGEDYYFQSPSTGYTFTTDGVNQFFSLPSDFFKALGVDLQITSPSQWVSLQRFNFNDRNRLSLTNSTVPMAGYTLRLFYAPRLTLLVGDSDTVDGVNGWEGFIAAQAAAKALEKEESDSSSQRSREQQFRDRITHEAENRDESQPATIVDSMGRRARAMMYRIAGNNIWLIGNGAPGWGAWGDWGADMDPYGGWY